jgi:hypothetical protein
MVYSPSPLALAKKENKNEIDKKIKNKTESSGLRTTLSEIIFSKNSIN